MMMGWRSTRKCGKLYCSIKASKIQIRWCCCFLQQDTSPIHNRSSAQNKTLSSTVIVPTKQKLSGIIQSFTAHNSSGGIGLRKTVCKQFAKLFAGDTLPIKHLIRWLLTNKQPNIGSKVFVNETMNVRRIRECVSAIDVTDWGLLVKQSNVYVIESIKLISTKK